MASSGSSTLSRRLLRGPQARTARLIARRFLLPGPEATETSGRASVYHEACKNASAATATSTVETPTTADGKTLMDLPGPPCWPVIGNLPMYLKKKNQGRLHEALTEQHHIHGGMFKEKLGPAMQLHLADPHLIEHVLRTEGRLPIRPTFNSWKLYRRVTGRPLGLFTGEGEDWKNVRRILNKRIMRPAPVAQYTGVLNEVAEDMVAKIRTIRDGEGENTLSAQLINEFYKWSMESVGMILFERRMGCLQPDMPSRVQEFIDAIESMMASSLAIIVGEETHRKYNTRFWQRHKNAWDKIFEIGQCYINEHMAHLEQRVQHGEDDLGGTGGLLTYLLAKSDLTPEQIYINVTELLLAGVDTTSNSLCFTLHLLSQHPEVQERLQKEVATTLGGTPPSADSIANMPYLKMVLREAQRLYPVVTMNCRVLEEDRVIGGYTIPKKTTVVMNHHAASRNNDIFPEADSFIPERWERSDHHPFASLPFGFGTRKCIGSKIARLELYLAICNICQQFNLEPIPGAEFKPQLRTLLTPGHTLPVRFLDR